MKVIGKEIGNDLNQLFGQIESRVKSEMQREIKFEGFEGETLSSVIWEEHEIKIRLHTGAPTHALPGIIGVALQHIRQRLDRFPTVRRIQQDIEGGAMVRDALRELILGPEASEKLVPLALDNESQNEQRPQGLKLFLRDAPPEFNEVGAPGNAFASLLFARYSIEHPEKMWAPLEKQFQNELPAAAENGKAVYELISSTGWSTAGAALESMILARDELNLQNYAGVEDRLKGEIL